MTVTPETGALEPDEVIGLNVRMLLYRGHRQQKHLALTLGVTPSVLSKKMRGESAWSARQVALTARFLDVEPGRLFAESSLPKTPHKFSLHRGEGKDTLPRPSLMGVVRT